MNSFGAEEERNASYIWKKYEKAQELSDVLGRFGKIQKCQNFYEGKQWEGAETGGEVLPTENIITPICKYKIAEICQANVMVTFLPVSNSASDRTQIICNRLNDLTAKYWEKNKMESKLWKLVRKACIAGSSFLHFWGDQLNDEMINSTNIFFADEQNTNLQEQDWIIIKGRKPLSYIKKIAKASNLSKEELEKIKSDNQIEKELGDDSRQEMDGEEKCTVLLYYERDPETGIINFARSTQNVIFEPLKAISGGNNGALSLYPIVEMIWEEKEGSLRGIGEVERLLNNQIAINKTVATRYVTTKMNAYGKPVATNNLINPDDIDKAGAVLLANDSAKSVHDVFTFVQPCPTSPEAKAMTDELRDVTRELSGGSDAALGNINPERASGYAISAAVSQASIPLSDQKASFKQACEDIGSVYKELLLAYRRDEVLDGLDDYSYDDEISVRTDVSSATAASRIAVDEILDHYLESGYISFEERVSALNTSSLAPKGVLEKILKERTSGGVDSGEQFRGEDDFSVGADGKMLMQSGAYENVGQFQ